MNFSILIEGSDSEYNQAMADALLKINNKYEITVDNHLNKSQKCKYSVILINNLNDSTGKIIWRYNNFKMHDKLNPITKYNKFQDIRILHQELLHIWQFHKEFNVNYTLDDKKIICVFSGMGGCGKTSFSKALAKELSYSGEKVLYVNIEMFSSQTLYFPKLNISHNINHYLYYLYKDNKNIPSAEGYVNVDNNGIYYFEIGETFNELLYLKNKELFISSIISDLNPDSIILDMDILETSNLIGWMNISNIMVMIEENNKIGKLKNDILSEELSIQLNASDIKFYKIINKQKNYDSTYNKEEFILPFEEESFIFDNGLIEINLDNNYGMGVRKFARNIRFRQ